MNEGVVRVDVGFFAITGVPMRVAMILRQT